MRRHIDSPAQAGVCCALRSRRGRRVDRQPDRLCQIAAEVDRQVRDGPQGPEIDLLPPRLRRIIGAGGDVGREITDAIELVSSS
jgi:hypothetical protein